MQGRVQGYKTRSFQPSARRQNYRKVTRRETYWSRTVFDVWGQVAFRPAHPTSVPHTGKRVKATRGELKAQKPGPRRSPACAPPRPQRSRPLAPPCGLRPLRPASREPVPKSLAVTDGLCSPAGRSGSFLTVDNRALRTRRPDGPSLLRPQRGPARSLAGQRPLPAGTRRLPGTPRIRGRSAPPDLLLAQTLAPRSCAACRGEATGRGSRGRAAGAARPLPLRVARAVAGAVAASGRPETPPLPSAPGPGTGSLRAVISRSYSATPALHGRRQGPDPQGAHVPWRLPVGFLAPRGPRGARSPVTAPPADFSPTWGFRIPRLTSAVCVRELPPPRRPMPPATGAPSAAPDTTATFQASFAVLLLTRPAQTGRTATPKTLLKRQTPEGA